MNGHDYTATISYEKGESAAYLITVVNAENVTIKITARKGLEAAKRTALAIVNDHFGVNRKRLPWVQHRLASGVIVASGRAKQS